MCFSPPLRQALVWRTALLFALSTLCGALALAASPAEQQEIEQRQRALLEEAARQREEVARPLSLPSEPTEQAPQAQGPCFQVNNIHFEGASQLSASQQIRLASPYINSCMGLSHINALIRDVSQWYLAAGFVTSRAPSSRAWSGRCSICVIWSRV